MLTISTMLMANSHSLIKPDIKKYKDLNKEKVYNCEVKINGIVTDEKTKGIIPEASILILNKKGEKIQQLKSNSEGFFSYLANCENSEEYRIKVEKDGYSLYNDIFSIEAQNKSTLNLKIRLAKSSQLELKEAQVGEDISELLNTNPIYFDVNKSNIRQDAQVELEKVINYMKKYPSVKIDVRSHSDSRSSDSYNLSLSQERNASTKLWIIMQGCIDPDRVRGRGYGETMILNRCKNGVECTKEEHENNRRSEFIVVSN